jgi:hypothetical protein
MRLTLILVSMTGMSLGQSVVLGVLEDIPEKDRDLVTRGIRVVFEKNGNDWKAFPSDCSDQGCLKSVVSKYPQQITWTISFDGKSLGKITGRTPKEFSSYSTVGLQTINGVGSIPIVGKKSAEYSGPFETPVHRPLVANSRGYFKDPDVWKPIRLSADFIKALQKGYRQKFPKLCRASENEDKLVPFSYRDDQLRVIRIYGSTKGWKVARLHLAGAIDCGDVEAGSQIPDQWFVVDPQKDVRYLGEGMWLVDAGDYDNDGKSEILFSVSRENRGGYTLFYDDFKKNTKFEFSYH